MRLPTRTEELILWSILQLQDLAYCVPIRDRIAEVTGEKWPLGSIYMPLDRLVRNGWLTSRFSESTPERGGRRKRIYHLTAEGRRALEQTRKVHHKMWESVPARLKES